MTSFSFVLSFDYSCFSSHHLFLDYTTDPWIYNLCDQQPNLYSALHSLRWNDQRSRCTGRRLFLLQYFFLFWADFLDGNWLIQINDLKLTKVLALVFYWCSFSCFCFRSYWGSAFCDSPKYNIAGLNFIFTIYSHLFAYSVKI